MSYSSHMMRVEVLVTFFGKLRTIVGTAEPSIETANCSYNSTSIKPVKEEEGYERRIGI